MKKLLLLLCLSLPAFGQIINPTSGLPSNYSVVDSNTLSGPTLTVTGNAYIHSPFNGDGIPNSSSGTSNGLLAKLVNNGGVVQIQTLGTSDTTSYPLLVVAQRNTSTNAINGCTAACTTNNAYVAAVGTVAACTFDNTAVVGDFVIDGTTGQCHDTGSATAPTSGTFVGRARTAGTGSQSVSIESQVAGGAGGASPTFFSVNPSATVTLVSGVETTIWTTTLGTNVATNTGQCFRVNGAISKSGATSTVYRLYFGATATILYNATVQTSEGFTADICTTSDTSHENVVAYGITDGASAKAIVTGTSTSDATNSATVIKFTATAASTEVVTPQTATVARLF